jgi:hypothetical protein
MRSEEHAVKVMRFEDLNTWQQAREWTAAADATQVSSPPNSAF